MVTEVSKGRDTTVPCFCGLSTDSKPTDAGNGAEFKEIDTGDTYYYNEAGATWVKWTGGSGGGGGSSDFSTATVTFNLTLPEGTTLGDLGGRVGFEFEDGIEYEAPLSTSATTLLIVLYKGEGYISNFYAETTDYDSLIFDGEPTLSDTVTWNGDKFTVTGDGTVTATMVVEGGSD